jgi:hypothetical protein
MRVRIVGTDLPGSSCGAYSDVHVGIQCGKEPTQLMSAGAAQVIFETLFRWVPVEKDFKGPCVQGRKGARFLYLTWGELPRGGGYVMFRRAKLWLTEIDESLLADGGDEVLIEGKLGLTDNAGLPVCASVRPPQIVWRRA